MAVLDFLTKKFHIVFEGRKSFSAVVPDRCSSYPDMECLKNGKAENHMVVIAFDPHFKRKE